MKKCAISLSMALLGAFKRNIMSGATFIHG